MNKNNVYHVSTVIFSWFYQIRRRKFKSSCRDSATFLSIFFLCLAPHPTNEKHLLYTLVFLLSDHTDIIMATLTHRTPYIRNSLISLTLRLFYYLFSFLPLCAVAHYRVLHCTSCIRKFNASHLYIYYTGSVNAKHAIKKYSMRCMHICMCRIYILNVMQCLFNIQYRYIQFAAILYSVCRTTTINTLINKILSYT